LTLLGLLITVDRFTFSDALQKHPTSFELMVMFRVLLTEAAIWLSSQRQLKNLTVAALSHQVPIKHNRHILVCKNSFT